MNDKRFFTLIDRAYERAGKSWDYSDYLIMGGALGVCNLDQEISWVCTRVSNKVRNIELLRQLAHLVGEETNDYNFDALVVEQATRAVLSIMGQRLSPFDHTEAMERMAWYRERTDVKVDPWILNDKVVKLIDELLELLEEEL